MKTKQQFIENLSPRKKEIGVLLNEGFTPNGVIKQGYRPAFVTMVIKAAKQMGVIFKPTTENFIQGLTPVKKEIGILLNEGFSADEVAKKIAKKNGYLIASKAYVTMVVDEAEQMGVAFNNKKEELHDYSVGLGKGDVRRGLLASMIKAAEDYNIVDGVILGLFSHQYIDAKLINKLYPFFKFLPYENKVEYIKAMVENIKTDKSSFMLKPINEPISNGIKKAKKDAFSHVLLDYCDGLAKHKEELAMAFKKDIVRKGGLIWVTVSWRTKVKDTKTQKELTEFITKIGGSKYRIIPKPSWQTIYRDTAGMVSIIVQRIK